MGVFFQEPGSLGDETLHLGAFPPLGLDPLKLPVVKNHGFVMPPFLSCLAKDVPYPEQGLCHE
jgi:hypothetical protein